MGAVYRFEERSLLIFLPCFLFVPSFVPSFSSRHRISHYSTYIEGNNHFFHGFRFILNVNAGTKVSLLSWPGLDRSVLFVVVSVPECGPAPVSLSVLVSLSLNLTLSLCIFVFVFGDSVCVWECIDALAFLERQYS